MEIKNGNRKFKFFRMTQMKLVSNTNWDYKEASTSNKVNLYLEKSRMKRKPSKSLPSNRQSKNPQLLQRVQNLKKLTQVRLNDIGKLSQKKKLKIWEISSCGTIYLPNNNFLGSVKTNLENHLFVTS